MSDVVEMFISDPGSAGGWFPLQRSDDKLSLHADTLASRSVTMKRTTASNINIPGTFTVNAVPDNAVENISIWVASDDQDELDNVVDHIIELFTRVSYTLMVIKRTRTELWTGQAADYTVSTTREYRHADRALLTLQAPILPTRRIL